MSLLKSIYATLSKHLTKVLGAAGASLMSLLAFVDPPVVRAAAQEYLGDHAAAKVGLVLFIFVFLRGIYTGMQAQRAAEALAAAKIAPAEIRPETPIAGPRIG